MTDDEANATVAYYDLDGTGEMSYEVLHYRILCEGFATGT